MKIAVASLGNPNSVETWSGIPAHIIYFLEKRGHNVVGITINAPKQPWYYDWLRRWYYRWEKKWFLAEVEENYLKAMGSQLDKEVALIKPDVVIVIHGDLLSFANFKQPVCIIHDATFATLLNYYPSFSNLTNRSITAGHTMYFKALKRADAAVFSSAWASASAIDDYAAPKSKIFTIPLGANLITVPNEETVKNWIKFRSETRICNLLFFGADWIRKGGPDALKVVIELNKIGVASKLIILGCDPYIPAECCKFVEKVGFLRKDVLSENEQLHTILKESHLLILPSIAECYGCVYCEANAYGLPILARATGGVSQIVIENINGYLLQKEQPAEVLAAKWFAVWSDREKYISLSLTALKEFNHRLNYNVFTEKLEPVLQEIVKIETING